MSDTQGNLDLQDETAPSGPVECLGITFNSDEERRAHFRELLRTHLEDESFRSIPGFPEASDEALLRMADPPYFTPCPNPFLAAAVEHAKNSQGEEEEYHREPLAIDVSEGKYDSLYRAHPYHTKVPHKAIVYALLHYTDPGDLVFDGFCGSGMTGVAAQWCGTADAESRAEIVSELGHTAKWGARRVILNDLSPAATEIAANFCLPLRWSALEDRLLRMRGEFIEELGWMYEVEVEGGASAELDYVVWTQIFTCPHCAGDIVFHDVALDEDGRTLKEFGCPHCKTDELRKKDLERKFETRTDSLTGKVQKRIELRPVVTRYDYENESLERRFNEDDDALMNRIENTPIPESVPSAKFPITRMYHGSRLEPKGFTHIHHLYTRRSAIALGWLWKHVSEEPDVRLRNAMFFVVDQLVTTGSLLNRYRPASSFGNGPLRGVYYVSSLIAEASIVGLLDGAIARVRRGFEGVRVGLPGHAFVSTGDASHTGIPDDSVDYVFTDPPFGKNIFYADLNLMAEHWYGVLTDTSPEAIVDKAKDKDVLDYQELMRGCFSEYFRILKPGRWMTVVFSNSSNSIWRAIQEALGTAGFVVADVRTLDKKQGSYRQVTSSAVKQDLVISAYKPTTALTEQFQLARTEKNAVWAFVREHLRQVPVFVGGAEEGEIVAERTPQMLMDRMIAFHVQRGIALPISGPDFLNGLSERFPERDGMHFLPDQIAEYDKRRTKVSELKQLTLFVDDEASAIQWVRQQLKSRPQTFQDLQPQFMREQNFAKHEQTVELKTILQQNFLQYSGRGPVPPQIHGYLSSNYKSLRNLEKDDPALVEKAKERWYVPDPGKSADIEKMRRKTLLKEFEDYRSSTGKLKRFRTEAVRAGFQDAYQRGDYSTIVSVGERVKSKILQQDEKLLMYYDVARMRLGDE